MALFKRILEIRGKFIPQQYKFLFGWVSKDRSNYDEWISINAQLAYCSYNTLEEAREAFKLKIHKA